MAAVEALSYTGEMSLQLWGWLSETVAELRGQAET